MSDSPEDEKMVPRFDHVDEAERLGAEQETEFYRVRTDDASEGGDDLMEAMGIDPKGHADATPDSVSSGMSGCHDTEVSASPVSTDGKESGTSNIAPSIPEHEREFYKCKKGHVTEDMWAHVARENAQGGEIIEDSGPICRRCFVRWIAKMFPAKRCAAPKELAVA